MGCCITLPDNGNEGLWTLKKDQHNSFFVIVGMSRSPLILDIENCFRNIYQSKKVWKHKVSWVENESYNVPWAVAFFVWLHFCVDCPGATCSGQSTLLLLFLFSISNSHNQWFNLSIISNQVVLPSVGCDSSPCWPLVVRSTVLSKGKLGPEKQVTFSICNTMHFPNPNG